MTTLSYATHVLAISLIIMVPVLTAYFIRKMPGAMWRHFLFGALVFFVVQMAFRTPLLKLLHLAPEQISGIAHVSTDSIIHLAIVALTAGILEEAGRFAGYRLLLRRDLNPRAGLMYGLGHGWIEGVAIAGWMALTLYAFSRIAGFDLSGVEFTPEQIGIIREASTWWRPMLGAFERIAMLPIHMALALVVLQSLRTGHVRWLVAAMAAHSIINFALALVIQRVGLLQGEILALLVSAASVIFIRELLRRDHTGTGPLGEESLPSSIGTITRTG